MYSGPNQRTAGKVGIVESGRNPAISTPISIPVSNAPATSNTSANWRDAHDSFSFGALNLHIPSATTANPTVSTAQTTQNVSFTSWGSFGPDNIDQITAQASGSGIQKDAGDEKVDIVVDPWVGTLVVLDHPNTPRKDNKPLIVILKAW